MADQAERAEMMMKVSDMAYLNPASRSLARQSGLGVLAAKVGRFAEALADSWWRARIYRETYAELDRLSAHELEDLGLTRSMISRVAFDAAYGRTA